MKVNDVYDYLEMAQNAYDVKETIRYAQKALKLDPYCLDAEMMIAQGRYRHAIREAEELIRLNENDKKMRRNIAGTNV